MRVVVKDLEPNESPILGFTINGKTKGFGVEITINIDEYNGLVSQTYIDANGLSQPKFEISIIDMGKTEDEWIDEEEEERANYMADTIEQSCDIYNSVLALVDNHGAAQFVISNMLKIKITEE